MDMEKEGLKDHSILEEIMHQFLWSNNFRHPVDYRHTPVRHHLRCSGAVGRTGNHKGRHIPAHANLVFGCFLNAQGFL